MVEKTQNDALSSVQPGIDLPSAIAWILAGGTQWLPLSAANEKISDTDPNPGPQSIVLHRPSAIQLVPDARPRHCRGHSPEYRRHPKRELRCSHG